MNEADLKNKLLELKRELMKQNAQIARGTSLKNPGQIKVIKKTMAKIHSLIHGRTLSLKQNTKEKSVEVKKQDE